MEDEAHPRRGRRLLTALAVAAAIAAVPAGVALAGGSGQPSGIEGQSGSDASEIQSTAPDGGERGDGQRGDGDRDPRDCPKDREGERSPGWPDSNEPGTTEL
jgi:hypothetical protein